MPSQSLNMTAIRGAHSARVWVTPMIGAAVFTATVSATPANGATALDVTAVSGSASDVKRGMRIVVRSSGGAYKGFTSVRYAGTISSSSLPIREHASGHASIVSGDVVTVYNDFVLSDKLVAATTGFEPDAEAYSDQNLQPAPLVCSGGWDVGWVDSGQTYRTITTYGADTIAVDPDGGTLNHAWTLLTAGLSFAPGSSATDASPTLRATVGWHVAQHVATNAGNSKSETQYVCYRVHDDADPPMECLLSGFEQEARSGGRASFALFENAGITSIPDGAWVMIWMDERQNGAAASYGSRMSSRSHILMLGLLRTDRSQLSSDVDDVEFEVISPLARLAEMTGYSKALENADTPSGWQQVNTLTAWRAFIQILRHYTNAPNLLDLLDDGIVDKDYPAFYLQRSTPYDQVTELADAIDCVFTCDRIGRLVIQRRLELTPLADRTTPQTIFTLTADDILDTEMTRQHWRPLEVLHAAGFTKGLGGGDNQPVFAKYPATPGRGKEKPRIERLIVEDVDDLYARTALRGAWENRDFFDAAGVLHHAPEARLTLPGSYAQSFQNYREWVAFSGVTTLRGVAFSDFRWIVERVRVDYADGTATTTLDLRGETHAPASAAADDTPPDAGTTPIDPPVTYPPVVVVTPPRDGDGLYGNIPTLAVFLSDGTLAYTANANTASPTWTTVNLSALGGWTGSGIGSFCAYPFSPKYIGGGSSVDGWLTTSSRILKITGIGASPTLADQQTISTPLGGAVDLLFERGVQNWGMCAVETGSGLTVYYTTNGTTWSSVTPDTDYDTSGQTWRSGLALSPHVAGKAYISVMDSTTANPDGSMLVTTDYGATWSALVSPAADQAKLRAGNLHVPYSRPAMDVIFYGYRTVSGIVNKRLRRTIGATTIEMTPTFGGNNYGVDNNRTRELATWDDDGNYLIAVLENPTAANTGIWYSENALATSPTLNVLAAPGTSYRGVYCVGRKKAYFIGVNGALGYWDGGSAIRSLTGNLSTTATVIGICGL